MSAKELIDKADKIVYIDLDKTKGDKYDDRKLNPEGNFDASYSASKGGIGQLPSKSRITGLIQNRAAWDDDDGRDYSRTLWRDYVKEHPGNKSDTLRGVKGNDSYSPVVDIPALQRARDGLRRSSSQEDRWAAKDIDAKLRGADVEGRQVQGISDFIKNKKDKHYAQKNYDSDLEKKAKFDAEEAERKANKEAGVDTPAANKAAMARKNLDDLETSIATQRDNIKKNRADWDKKAIDYAQGRVDDAAKSMDDSKEFLKKYLPSRYKRRYGNED